MGRSDRLYTLEKACRAKLDEIFGRRKRLIVHRYSHHAAYTSSHLARAILHLLSVPAALFNSRHVIPHIDLDVTSRCTLNCKECNHLTPLHKQHNLAKDYPLESLLENIDLVMPHIDKCLLFSLVGGEPLLYKDLYLIIRKLINEKKVKYIQVFTNGTIIPSEEILAAMRHKKVSVFISNYGALSTKKEKLAALLRKRGIRYRLSPYSPTWVAWGDVTPKDYSVEQMHTIFNHCRCIHGKALYDGKLWLCQVALQLAILNLSKKNENEYIDLRTCTKQEFWIKLEKMFNNPSEFTTCYHCYDTNSLDSAAEVPAAEQLQH